MIEVNQTHDYDLVKQILTDDDIWWRISDTDKEGFVVPPEPIYLLATVLDQPAALFVLHEEEAGYGSHFQALPLFRRYKDKLGRAVLKKAKEYTDKLSAEIPKRFDNVKRFALDQGYKIINEDDENWYFERKL